MFENLLHQETVAKRLESDLLKSALPPSLLLSGSPLSGKLTAALELARGLSCSQERTWNCSCSSCRHHRLFTHPWTVLAGYRDNLPEIFAAAEVLRRDFQDAPRYLFVRSVRKLLRRFDSFLWEGDERKLTRVRPLMEPLSESLEILAPGGVLPEKSALEDRLEGVLDACGELQKILPGLLPVAQVRRLELWAFQTASQHHKTIILDGADRMPESSRNALLKFLEEPPGNTTVILLTNRKSLILPTILSRLRDYAFRRRLPPEEAGVLRRVFREDEKRWGGLGEYFQAWRMGPVERLQEFAVQFVNHARSGEPQMPVLEEPLTNPRDFTAFLEVLAQELRHRWRKESPPDHRRAAREAKLLRDTRLRLENLNLGIPLLFQGLYAALEREP